MENWQCGISRMFCQEHRISSSYHTVRRYIKFVEEKDLVVSVDSLIIFLNRNRSAMRVLERFKEFFFWLLKKGFIHWTELVNLSPNFIIENYKNVAESGSLLQLYRIIKNDHDLIVYISLRFIYGLKNNDIKKLKIVNYDPKLRSFKQSQQREPICVFPILHHSLVKIANLKKSLDRSECKEVESPFLLSFKSVTEYYSQLTKFYLHTFSSFDQYMKGIKWYFCKYNYRNQDK